MFQGNQELEQFLAQRQAKQQTLTLVTGVFDILHPEHLAFLQAAKKTADLLLLGLESDARVRQIKGPGRPINSEQQRLLNLKKEQLADLIFILPEDFASAQAHEDLIAYLRPDFLAVSAHTSYIAEKRRIVEKFGGRLLIVREHNPNYSTTRILRKPKSPSKAKKERSK